ncbi:pilin [Lysobacter sp. TLK-CK17T]|uniref:Pilin n=1 Tax=Marilutibacter chinensis TaxID=2912247 RepID=A0ABS9HT09_9GAMM|nr:pilin [Lysobacter chinensis]
MAAGAKLAVSETAQDRGSLGMVTTTNTGFSFAASSYCASVTVAAGGDITAVTQQTGGPDVTFTLAPEAAAGRIDWDCSATGQENDAQIPAECR